MDPATGTWIPPNELFGQAEQQGLGLALDRVCRKRAFEGFASDVSGDVNLLSVNLDTSYIDHHIAGSRYLLRQVQRAGVAPNRVVLEILESQNTDLDALLQVVAFYRQRNFLIALDDVGSGFSNLDRICLIQPDILKMDRSLVDRVDQHFHKQELIRSFVQLGSRIGSQVVAEGVEREEEVLCLLDLGVEFFQGFYFARPEPGLGRIQEISTKMEWITRNYRQQCNQSIQEKHAARETYTQIMDRIVADLEHSAPEEMDSVLARYIESEQPVECLYVLDSSGIQISMTICDTQRLRTSHQMLYEPAKKGADHSLKAYYMALNAGRAEYSTEPYISLASGNACVTFSRYVGHSGWGQGIILCADIVKDNAGVLVS